MTLLIAMLPFYIFGNIHCFGMCGPLAMLLARSPFRGFYLLGRLFSFTLAGVIAGSIGEVLGALFNEYFLSGFFSLGLGLFLIVLAFVVLFKGQVVGKEGLGKFLAPFEEKLQSLIFKNAPWPLFMFGFLTIFLPCGQSLLVFSACALSGSAAVGALNGFVFAALTTPSLFLAMKTSDFFKDLRVWYVPMVALSIAFLGVLFFLRGMADFGFIPHFGFKGLVFY